MPEDSFEARLNGTSPVKIKRDGPGAWRAFTFIFALLFVIAGVGVAYFYNRFYQTEESYNKLADQANKNSNQQAQQNGASGSSTADIVDITGGYIKLGDTGLYLKYPEGVSKLSYTIDADGDEANGWVLSAKFTGYPTGAPSDRNYRFANIDEWHMASISITKKTADYKTCEQIKADAEAQNLPAMAAQCFQAYVDDDYVVSYSGPQNITTEIDEDKEKEIVNFFQEWISNSDNYVRN